MAQPLGMLLLLLPCAAAAGPCPPAPNGTAAALAADMTPEQVEAWALGSAGFARYAPVLREQEVDMATLTSVSEQALMAAGLPLGVAFNLKRCAEDLLSTFVAIIVDEEDAEADKHTPTRPAARRLHEGGGGGACDLAKLEESILDVDMACCQAGHTGHRRAQGDEPCSSVPDTCGAGCAPVFVPFYEACADYLAIRLPENTMAALTVLYGACPTSNPGLAPPPPSAPAAMPMEELVGQMRQLQAVGGAPLFTAPAAPAEYKLVCMATWSTPFQNPSDADGNSRVNEFVAAANAFPALSAQIEAEIADGWVPFGGIGDGAGARTPRYGQVDAVQLCQAMVKY
eukprot:COSAG04_NODE_2047_length_4911_cov_11.776673_4_plen_342_part_00